nr:response regulator [Oxalobacteraceae bacterium]
MTAPRSLSESAATPILLVEDDPSLREALEVTLAMEDIAFIAVDSAEDAITALRSGSYRVLVSDIRLP